MRIINIWCVHSIIACTGVCGFSLGRQGFLIVQHTIFSGEFGWKSPIKNIIEIIDLYFDIITYMNLWFTFLTLAWVIFNISSSAQLCTVFFLEDSAAPGSYFFFLGLMYTWPSFTAAVGKCKTWQNLNFTVLVPRFCRVWIFLHPTDKRFLSWKQFFCVHEREVKGG